MSSLFNWPFSEFRKTLHVLNERLTESKKGSLLSALISIHFDEVFHLIYTNRRVATVWHRNLGPDFVQYLLRIAQSPDTRLPENLKARDVAKGLDRFFEVLKKYGSESLKNDIRRYSPFVRSLLGKRLGLLQLQD
jgi:hypothetical protein